MKQKIIRNKKAQESAYVLPVEDLYLEVMNYPLNKQIYKFNNHNRTIVYKELS